MADAAPRAVSAPRSFVLGGGVGGIAAALELAARGHRVVLFEHHRALGGRVSSRRDDKLGIVRDNGPHVMLGCYDAFRALLGELGTLEAFVAAPALGVAYADARGNRAELRLSALPVPLAMPWAVLRLSAMTFGERLRALWGLLGNLVGAPADASLEQWLVRWRQHGGPRRFLWDPLCLAVMNAAPTRVSARLFLQTMRRAFTGRAARGAIWIPDRPWAEIVGEPALRVLEARGVDVRLGCRVRALATAGARVTAIELDVADEQSSSEVVAADALVVSTLPWHRLATCLAHDDPVVMRARAFAGAPIVSVYFALDADPPLPAAPLVALVDGAPFHFLVRRPSEPKRHFALLAGGADVLDGVGVDAILAQACAQLARHFPGVRARPDQARVVKEAQATLLVDARAHAQRPACGAHPAFANLILAGDWCATDLPSTMEGAALSVARALGS